MIASAVYVGMILYGCASPSGVKQDPPVPPGATGELTQLTPRQFATFQPVINRYFYLRKRAVIEQDPAVLYGEYPELQHGTDQRAAINAEAGVVDRFQGLEVIDGNIELEYYSRFLGREDGDKAVVLVNGLELYLRRNFEDTGGQLQIMLFLERRDGGWTVVKIDETTDAEYHQALRR